MPNSCVISRKDDPVLPTHNIPPRVEQTEEVALYMLHGLRAGEATAYTLAQRSQQYKCTITIAVIAAVKEGVLAALV